MTDKLFSLPRYLIILVSLAQLALIQPALAASENWRSPETVEGTTTITASEAKKLFDDGAVFIDVRNPRFFASGHIPGAHHLDLKKAFDQQAVAAIADKHAPLVIYCSGVMCSRSYRGSEKAVSWGYTQVKYFRGGIADWKEAGYPVTEAQMPDTE